MALDPLKFKIAIDKRQLQEDLQQAYNILKNGLKDVPVNIRINNLAEIQALIQAIGEKIGTMGGNGGSNSNINKELKSFEELKKKIDEASKAFENDKELKNYMKNMEALNVAIGQMRKSLGELRRAEQLANQSGADSSRIQSRIAETRERIRMLRELRENTALLSKSDALTTPQGLGQTAAVWREFSQFLSGNNSIVQKMKAFADSADNVNKSIGRMQEAIKRLSETNATGMREYGKRNLLAGDALRDARDWMNKAQTVDHNDANAVRALMNEYLKLAEAMKKAQAEQDALNKAGKKDKLAAESAAARALKEQEAAAERATKAIERLEGMYTRLNAVANQSGVASGSSVDRLREITEWIARANNTNFADKAEVRTLMQDYYRLRDAIKETTKEQQKLNSAEEKRKSRQQAQDTKEMQRIAEQAQKATVEIVKLEIELRKLSEISAKGKALGMDTSKLDSEISHLRAYLNILKEIQNGTRTDNFKTIFGAGFDSTRVRAKDESQQLTEAIRKEEQAKKQAAQATQQLTTEEQKLAQSIQQTISQLNHQSQVLSDLKMMAAQYLSIYGAQQFLNNIIEIGGQLEMQRLSIGAILQDSAQATDLFDRIKALALQSPFGVVELDQFTKQLSAYGFQYNELFDMTKRLADISAGAGTDVSRLALALGHVRAEGALTGYTLRQFAMNNIPMLGKLSEKLSEIEGRRVTAGEVRKRVREKEIDYHMVEEVIKELTNEGGMFYNMQETISQSVKAKWKNLRDAFDIMYGEMAESAIGGALKNTASTLTAMAKRWKELGAIIKNVAIAYGTWKTVMLIYNTLLGQQARAVFMTISAEKQAEISKLRLASVYRTLTVAERQKIASGLKLSATEITMAINTKKLTMEELQRAIALGKLNKAMAISAINHARLGAVQKSTWVTAVNNVRTYGIMTSVVNGTAMAFTRLGTALKGLIFNWTTAIFAAITAITELWQRNNIEMERATEVSKTLENRAHESVRNTQAMMSETGMKYMRDGKAAEFSLEPGGTFVPQQASSLEPDAMVQNLEKWETYIKNYSSMANTLIQNALFDNHELRDLSEQYNNLAEAVGKVAKEQQALAQIADSAEGIIKSTQTSFKGLFDDDIITNMDDYAKKVRSTESLVSKFSMNHRAAMAAVLNAAKADRTFAKAIAETNEQMLERQKRTLTDEEMFKELVQRPEQYYEAIRKAEAALADLGARDAMKSFSSVKSAAVDENSSADTLLADMNIAADAIRQTVKEKWHKDISELEDYEKAALLRMVSDIAAKSGESTEEIRNKIIHLFADILKIPIDIKETDAILRISAIEQELKKLVEGPDGTGSWDIDIKGVVDVNGLIQKVREGYKKAQDTITNLGPIAIKMGISLGKVKIMTDEEINAAAGDSMIKKMALKAIRDAYQAIADAEKASKTYGFDLVDHTTSGKVFKAKKDKEKKESKEDPESKEWKERIRLLKDARSWYDKWEKEVGHSAALDKVQNMFKNLISKKDIESLEAYKKALQDVYNKAAARKKTRGGKDEHADEAMRQAKEAMEAIDYMIFQRDRDAFTAGMEKDISNLTRQWDTFNSVLEATGDRLLALRMAGLIGRSGSERNAADSLRSNIEAMPGGNLIDFQEILGMDDKGIEERVKDLLGTSDKYSMHIDSIIKGLKEWRKLSENVMKQDIQDYAQLLSQAVDYEAQIKKINATFIKQKEYLDALFNNKKITSAQYNAGINRISANKARGLVEALPEYKMLMDGVLSITKSAAKEVKEKLTDALYKQLITGAITAKEYADKINEISEKMRQLDLPRSMFGSFMEGGLSGLQQHMQKDAQDTIRQGAEQMQMGMFNMHQGANGGGMQQILDGFNQLSEGNKMTQMGEGMQGMAGNFATTIMIIDKIIHGIDGIIQGLKNAYDNITEMLSALGSESAKDPRSGWGKAGTFLSALSSGSQSATQGWDSLKNGDMGGVINGVVGSFTGPITAIARAHDARRQAAIDELVFEVKKIDNTLTLIRDSRERTLGYDNGNYRREMSALYSGYNYVPTSYVDKVINQNKNAAEKAMYEFYSRGGTEGTGYAQELESLKKQREDYLRMYDEENAKKDESKDALEEYKAKIAELDSQIKNYAMDLANELWSIDLKGWADQIGDALMNAFENGTSAAEAFKDATADIMRSVVSEMLKIGFMQPMMEKLRDRLFGENGAFNYADPKSSMGAVLSELGKFFGQGGEGQQMIVASQEFLSGAEELLNKNYGLSLKDSSQSTQTKGIQSQATEESIGILSGQMARIAQDVSVKRIFITQIATEQMPRLLETAQMQQTLLENQFQSVRAIEHMMADGDGALYASIDRMSRKIDRAITPEGRMRIE